MFPWKQGCLLQEDIFGNVFDDLKSIDYPEWIYVSMAAHSVSV